MFHRLGKLKVSGNGRFVQIIELKDAAREFGLQDGEYPIVFNPKHRIDNLMEVDDFRTRVQGRFPITKGEPKMCTPHPPPIQSAGYRYSDTGTNSVADTNEAAVLLERAEARLLKQIQDTKDYTKDVQDKHTHLMDAQKKTLERQTRELKVVRAALATAKKVK